ncbi:UNKNOWN [Stylonychia lemnae]|uniref:Uncharacterized protein n=1 Tax=Stylonychia lemnae TaxID=5949 RepID=A0A077ZY69_STYLE|nr:UNKNOWN [Stylonychia lemnae]|eukprot:CDW73496.1 UNKNOWN [Stylonychia lemnae]
MENTQQSFLPQIQSDIKSQPSTTTFHKKHLSMPYSQILDHPNQQMIKVEEMLNRTTFRYRGGIATTVNSKSTRKVVNFSSQTTKSSHKRVDTQERLKIQQEAQAEAQKIMQEIEKSELLIPMRMGFTNDDSKSVINIPFNDRQKFLDHNDLKSNMKFANKEQLQEMNTKFQYQKVKEATIPLYVLYNDSINKLKQEEKDEMKDPKPLAFSIKTTKNKVKTIRFEILGQNAQIEALIDEGDDKDQERDFEDEDINGLKLISEHQSTKSRIESKEGFRGRRASKMQFQIKVNDDHSSNNNNTTPGQSPQKLVKKNTLTQNSIRKNNLNISTDNVKNSQQKRNFFAARTPQSFADFKINNEGGLSPLKPIAYENFSSNQLSPFSGHRKSMFKYNNDNRPRKSSGSSRQKALQNQNRELKLEKILESDARGTIKGNQVIKVDIKLQRLRKLNQLQEEMKQKEHQLELQLSLQKQKVFQKWFLSPSQFSDKCKLIEQKSKPSQERDSVFQDKKTVREMIEEIRTKFKIEEEKAKEFEYEDSSSGDETENNDRTQRRYQSPFNTQKTLLKPRQRLSKI